MQVARAALAPAGESDRAAESQRVSRRLYVPTILIAGLAAWLSYRGWTALAETGVARSFDVGRYNLAGPVVLGFVLTVCVLEQVFPAQQGRDDVAALPRGRRAARHLRADPPAPVGVVTLLLTAALLWQRR
jgi:hypothetical protein